MKYVVLGVLIDFKSNTKYIYISQFSALPGLTIAIVIFVF